MKLLTYTSGKPESRSEMLAVSQAEQPSSSAPSIEHSSGELYIAEHGLGVSS